MQVIPFLGGGFVGLYGFGQFRFQGVQFFIIRRIGGHRRQLSRDGVHQMGLEVRAGQQQGLVLRMDIDQPVGHGPQGAQIDRDVVDERPAFSGCRDRAPDGDFVGPVQIVLFEDGQQFVPVAADVENRFDGA